MKKSFNVMGRRIKVKYVKNYIVYNNQNCYGLYKPKESLIIICTRCDGEDRDESDIIQTLYHELTHAIFDRIGIHQTSIAWELEEIIAEAFGNVLSENGI